jgi:hypothetical protein
MRHKILFRRGAFIGPRGLAGILILVCVGCNSQRITDGNDNSAVGTYTVDYSASMDSLQDSMNSLEHQARQSTGDMVAMMATAVDMTRVAESAADFMETPSCTLVLQRDGTAELITLPSTSTANLDSTVASKEKRGTWSAAGDHVTINLTDSSGAQSKTLGILQGNTLNLTGDFGVGQFEYLVLTR